MSPRVLSDNPNPAAKLPLNYRNGYHAAIVNISSTRQAAGTDEPWQATLSPKTNARTRAKHEMQNRSWLVRYSGKTKRDTTQVQSRADQPSPAAKNWPNTFALACLPLFAIGLEHSGSGRPFSEAHHRSTETLEKATRTKSTPPKSPCLGFFLS